MTSIGRCRWRIRYIL